MKPTRPERTAAAKAALSAPTEVHIEIGECLTAACRACDLPLLATQFGCHVKIEPLPKMRATAARLMRERIYHTDRSGGRLVDWSVGAPKQDGRKWQPMSYPLVAAVLGAKDHTMILNGVRETTT